MFLDLGKGDLALSQHSVALCSSRRRILRSRRAWQERLACPWSGSRLPPASASPVEFSLPCRRVPACRERLPFTSTLPVQLFFWAMLAVALLFVVSWYLEVYYVPLLWRNQPNQSYRRLSQFIIHFFISSEIFLHTYPHPLYIYTSAVSALRTAPLLCTRREPHMKVQRLNVIREVLAGTACGQPGRAAPQAAPTRHSGDAGHAFAGHSRAAACPKAPAATRCLNGNGAMAARPRRKTISRLAVAR